MVITGMREIKTTIGRNGRVNIPAEHRRALGLEDGDEVLVGVVGGHVRIEPRRAAFARARAIVAAGLSGALAEGRGPDSSEDLSRERRAEARREG